MGVSALQGSHKYVHSWAAVGCIFPVVLLREFSKENRRPFSLVKVLAAVILQSKWYCTFYSQRSKLFWPHLISWNFYVLVVETGHFCSLDHGWCRHFKCLLIITPKAEKQETNILIFFFFNLVVRANKQTQDNLCWKGAPEVTWSALYSRQSYLQVRWGIEPSIENQA